MMTLLFAASAPRSVFWSGLAVYLWWSDSRAQKRHDEARRKLHAR
jgi:hypothetical protein